MCYYFINNLTFGGIIVNGKVYLFVAFLYLSVLTTACVDKELDQKASEPTASEEVTQESNEASTSSEEELSLEDLAITEGSTGANAEQAVYDYMVNAYHVITNNGEEYDPELHDPMVANLASMQFNISEEEAQEIFVRYQTFMNEATP
jgi:hypothetical protein